MRKPIVLLSPDFTRKGAEKRDRIMLELSYHKMIMRAGGNPVLLSPYSDIEELARLAGGWFITGGDDLPGEMFGRKTHPKANLAHPLRVEMERRLYSLFNDNAKPILGACFGAQFLAVVNNGTIAQHLPDKLGHENHTEGITKITLCKDSRLISILHNEQFEAACFHHQAIESVGAGWKVAARAEDGTIEAIEKDSHRWRFGIQWHPERTPDAPETVALFRSFIDACSNQL